MAKTPIHFVGHFGSLLVRGVATNNLYWQEGAADLYHEWRSTDVRGGAPKWGRIGLEDGKRRMRKWGGTYAPEWSSRRLTKLAKEIGIDHEHVD